MQSKRNQNEPLSELLESYEKGQKKRKILRIVLTPFLISSLLFFVFWGPLEVPVLSQVGRSILGIEKNESKTQTKQEITEIIPTETEIKMDESTSSVAEELEVIGTRRDLNNYHVSNSAIIQSVSPQTEVDFNVHSEEIEKCTASTVAEYKGLLSTNTEMFEYHDKLRNSNLNNGLVLCENNNDDCISKIEGAVSRYFNQLRISGGSTAPPSGYELYLRDSFEKDLQNQCRKQYTSCINAANDKYRSDSKALEYEIQVKQYQKLLDSCL